MKLLGRKKDDTAADVEAAVVELTDDNVTARATGTTAPKGRPTPKRNANRGPVAPAPTTAAEARARRKSLAGPKLSPEERRAAKAARRERMTVNRERMMAGDEAYLLPRDQGPVRRFVRDVVDARRNVLGLFMPSALVMLFVMMAVPVPQVQLWISPAMMLLMLLMAIDGVIIGRKVTRRVDEKFPDNTESRFKLGLYAAGRASQLRRMRAPRPQVNRGDRVD